jgi:hypothetical protein
MESASSSEEQNANDFGPAIEAGTRFLRALFSESDTILYRPIETWVEADKKRSRVDYQNTYYRRAVPSLLHLTVAKYLNLAEKERLNIFFGVCPRVGDKGRYDLAWQIRTVRSLWTDIDHVSVEESLERVTKAGLPSPSIVVNSGNGVHLYWLLDEPYLIDDAGDPPPVETEWTQLANGRKQSRKYIVEDGERVYLDLQRHNSRLSAKAKHVQDVLSGIAQALKGDHTTDLARLLRIPGTWNRKDQRNGRVPVESVLVKCDPSRRYSLAIFEALKTESPSSEREKQIAAMPLPQTKTVSPSRADKLGELIAASSIAPSGHRSEADFAVCCYAIRNGIAKEEVWGRVGQVGKFAESGERYFDFTWSKAEIEVRGSLFEKLLKTQNPKAKSRGAVGPRSTLDDFAQPGNDLDGGSELQDRPTIVVDPVTIPVAETLRETTDYLLATKYCFTRTDQLVVGGLQTQMQSRL